MSSGEPGRTKNGRVRRLIRREEGAALVEFALVAVVFFTVVFAIIQGGIVFGSWIVVTNAVREGARFASPCISRAEMANPTYCVGDWSSDAAIRNTVAAYTEGRMAWPNPADPAFGINTVVTYDPVGASPRLVKVQISYGVPLLAPLMGALLPDPLPLSAESDMRIED